MLALTKKTVGEGVPDGCMMKTLSSVKLYDGDHAWWSWFPQKLSHQKSAGRWILCGS